MRGLSLLICIVLCCGQYRVAAQCTNVALGKPATASSVWQTNVAANAVNGSCGDMWNSGNYAVQSFQVDLLANYTINNINIMFSMAPNGNVNHQIFTSPDMVTWTQADVVTGFYVTGQLIERCYSAAPLTNVRGVRVTSNSSPSWIAIIEMGVFTISAPTTPTITASGPLALCPGQSVTLTASAANSYLWSSGQTTQSITVSTPGNYTVSTNQSPSCTQGTIACTTCGLGTASVTVTANPAPVISVTPAVANICNGTTATLTASGANTYTWSPAVGLSATTGASVIASPTVITTYTVTGTDTQGCIGTQTVTADVVPQPAVSIRTPANPLCDSTRLNWATWTSVSATTGTGTISSNLSVTIDKPTGGMSTTGVMYNGGAFPPQFSVPINNVALRNDLAGLFTFCFNVPVINPQIAMASIGNPGNPVTVNTSDPYVVIWPGQGMSYPNSTTFTGTEGFTILQFPGTHTCISFDYLESETYCNLAFGTLDTNCQELPRPPICPGTNDTLIATGALNYTWSPATGLNTTTGSVVIASPLVTTTYYVVGTDVNNCIGTDSVVVNVHPATVFSAGADVNVCENTSVTLAANPINAGWQYSWEPAAALAGANTATASLTATATTNFTLTATDLNGCTNTDDVLLTVYPNPVAGYTVSDHCLGTPASFIDNSSFSNAPIVNRNLVYGDGNATTTGAPYTYTAAGTYLTSLFVTDNLGCVDSLVNVPLTVWDLPTPNFTYADACFGSPNTFTSTSTQAGPSPITNTAWDFGDNNQVLGTPATNTYSASGTYTVTLGIEDQNGCQNQIQQALNVYPLPLANFSASNVCFGEAICPVQNSTIPAPEIIATYNWDWGDGSPPDITQSPCHTYAAAGTYTILLTLTSGNACIDTFSQSVITYELPTANFNFTNVCDGQQMNFTNTSVSNDGIIAQNNWDYGDGNTALNQLNGNNTYSTFGTYTAQLAIASEFGCADTSSQIITIYAAPQVGFSFANACENVAITFTDTSIPNPPATITAWDWTFGDGSTNAATNSVSHTYATDGTFNATLAVTTSDGCVASVTNQIISYPEPLASFTVAEACENDPSFFVDVSTISLGTITSHLWDFGGGNTDVMQNPSFSFTFNSPITTYPVTLTVTSNFGCLSDTTQDAVVNPLPTGNYTVSPQPVCVGQPVTVTGTNSNPAIPITNWDYNWNNFQGLPLPSAHAYTQSATYTYNTSLTYNVRLTLTSDKGCTNFVTNQIAVSPIPYANFNFENVCEGNLTTFVDASTIVIGTIASWDWTFGDGGNSTTQNPTHLYATSGSYPVTLLINSADNCSSSQTYYLTVNPNPLAILTATPVCEGLESSFTSQSTISSGSITTYLWNFGDATPTDNNQIPAQHIFNTANNYEVVLTTTSDSGCVNSDTLNYSVFPNPVVSFSFIPDVDSCLPVAIRFVNNSTVATISGQSNTSISTFNYGDGETGTSVNHTYTSDGFFDVILTVSTENNCTSSDTALQLIRVFPVPTAEFSQSQNEVDLFDPNVQFTNLSSGETLYDWTFSDGSPNEDIPSPAHTFSDTGCYPIWLYVENQYGCADSISHEVCVRPFYALYIPNSFTPNVDIHNPSFNAIGEGVKEFEMRIFNRWGEEVFRTKSLAHGWNGTLNSDDSKEALMDVYAYWISSKDFKGRRHLYQGHVTLIR